MPKFRFPKLSRRTTALILLTIIGLFVSLAWVFEDLRHYEPIISSLTHIVGLITIWDGLAPKNQ